jgi:aminoglycoside/choline kinase family phosphotransferase
MSEEPRIRNAATPTLLHPDLHKRNIFVSDDDPAVITGIIDWQSSSIEPAFWYADDVPDFARPIAHPSLEDQIEPSTE